MHSMFTIILPLLATHPTLSSAHTRFTTLHINSLSQGDGVCIRQDRNPDTTTDYLASLTSATMSCGVDGNLRVRDTCALTPGDTIALEHRMWPDGSQGGAIDDSHKGSTAVYMKKVRDWDDDPSGEGWFKLFWDGYDGASREWGTERMNAADGRVSAVVPHVESGLYLLRSEVLALQVVGGPQMYVGCAQVRVEGGGGAGKAPSAAQTVSIPGYVDMDTDAMRVNIYEDFVFDEFGPPVYGAGGNGTAGPASSGAGAGTGNGETGFGAVPVSGVGEGGNVSPVVQDSPPQTSTTAEDSARPSAWRSWVSSANSNTTASGEDREELENDSEDEDSADDEETSNSDSTSPQATHSWSNWGRWNRGHTRVPRRQHSIRGQFQTAPVAC